MPFQVEERAEVLWLTLDTPGASVNIFNRATAAQTLELMRAVDPRRIRAVVIRTAKPASFINGAGVLLVTYVKRPEEVEVESLPYRQAYAAVRDCPVPTVAAIEGSCWGCGLELALQCDHRIGSDSHATQFRMTELTDYVEVPLLGSTRDLPRAVGLRRAIDLLLWGERWGARQALREGLLQEVAPHQAFASAVDDFVQRVLRGEVPPRERTAPREEDAAAALAEARARVEDLPPLYHRTFNDTLDLLELTARGEVGAEHERRGLAATCASTTHPSAKAAYGMFHVRQTAATLAAWGAAPGGEHAFAPASVAPAAAALYAELRARQPLPGVQLASDRSAGSTALVGPGQARAPEEVEVSPALAAPASRADSIVWPLQRRPLLELRAARGARGPLAQALQRAGFQVALSEGEAYASYPLLGAFLAPLVAAVEDGETPHTVDRALRELGMFRRAPALIGELGTAAAAELAARASGDREPAGAAPALERLAGPADFRAGRDAPDLVDEVLLWLLRAARDSTFSHPSFVDLAARELLDFPVARLSLCAHLTPDRARRALEGARRVPPAVRECARAYVQAGKGFYR